jgi:hypothetical protein
VNKIKGALKWIKLFILIFRGRSKVTYGVRHIENIFNKFHYEYLVNKEELSLAEQTLKKIAEKIEVVNLGELIRIGPKYDAGYLCLDLYKTPNLLSGGAGKNIDFEKFFASRGSRVDIYDPTVKVLNNEMKNINHYQTGLEGTESGKFMKSRNLESAYKILSPNNDKNLGNYLKLDIEGSEWDLLEQSLEQIDIFDQMFIEFHNLYMLSNAKYRNTYEKVNDYLFSHFYVVAINSNNWDQFINFGKSFTPITYEITFVNKRHHYLLQTLSQSNYHELISSNNQNRPAIFNKPFFKN